MSAAIEALAYDPQTSGGLLAAVRPDQVDRLPDFVSIGTVEPGDAGVELR